MSRKSGPRRSFSRRERIGDTMYDSSLARAGAVKPVSLNAPGPIPISADNTGGSSKASAGTAPDGLAGYAPMPKTIEVP